MDEEPLNFKCRLCGVHESKTLAMAHIFKPENFVAKIHKVLPLSINEYDPLPKRICYVCLYKVNDFNVFLETSVKTQELLKRELSWCKSKYDEEVVSIKPSAPLMEVIKTGEKSLNDAAINSPQLHPQKGGSHKISEISQSTKSVEKNVCKKRANASFNDVAACTTESFSTTISTPSVTTSVSVSMTSTVTSTSSVSSHTDLQKDLGKNASTSKSDEDETKKKKLLLTLKKDNGFSDSWSVPPSVSKRKKHSESEFQRVPDQQENMETNENKKSHYDIQQKTVKSKSNSKAMKESNLKELNGQHSKKVNHKSVPKSGDTIQTLCTQETSVSSCKQSVSVSNEEKQKIPDYLILTKVPLCGTIYTCLYCEQTFVSQVPACSHKCDKIIDMLRERCAVNKECENNTSDIYICDICDLNFSRHASLVAHRSIHYSNVSDNDSDNGVNDDENIIFFGQKKKKKPKIVRKVITDQDGNYL